MKKLSIINLILLIGIILYLLFFNTNKKEDKISVSEISTERLNIVGKDGNKYVVVLSSQLSGTLLDFLGRLLVFNMISY